MIFKQLLPPFVVPSASTGILKVDTSLATELFVVMTVATAALTGFSIKARPSTYTLAAVTLYSTSADYTTPSGLLVGTSGDLSVAGTGVSWFIMDVKALQSIEIWATSGGTATLALDVGAY